MAKRNRNNLRDYIMHSYECLYDPKMPIRLLLIEAAELDVQCYFRTLGEIVLHDNEVHISELDWLVHFKGQLQDLDIAKFLNIYRLRCFLQFRDLCGLRKLIQQWVSKNGPIRLDDRVKQFRETMFFPTEERSAVSKLSFFANPLCAIFIWDSCARRAIDYRYPLRTNPRTSGYTVEEFPQFCENAARCLLAEESKRDFQAALSTAVRLLNPVRERVFDCREVAIQKFAARRLLDKLMYYEGCLLEKRLMQKLGGDPCGAAAERVVRGWIQRLRADLAAADMANRRPDAAD